MELDTDQVTSNEFIAKLTKHSGRQTNMVTKTILDRFLNSPRYRDSQTNIGWDENTCAAYDVIASEDHSYIVTRWERNRNENSWKLVLNSEGANGPVDRRDDYKVAKKSCDWRYREYAATAGYVNTRSSSTKTRRTIRRT